MLHTMHTIVSPTALNTDAGRQPLPSITLFPHIHPADPFIESPRIHFTENVQSPVPHQDDEDEDLVVVVLATPTQTPIRKRSDKALGIMMSSSPSTTTTNAAALKRAWNATKGIFRNKNKRIPCNDDDDDDDDDEDSFVFVSEEFQTPDRRPTTNKFTMNLCPPPAPERETKKAELCNTESVLEIVRPAPLNEKEEETRKEFAAWIRNRNTSGWHAVCHTPLRSRTSMGPPRSRRPVARKVKLGDATVLEEMRMAARVAAKRLQTVY